MEYSKIESNLFKIGRDTRGLFERQRLYKDSAPIHFSREEVAQLTPQQYILY